MGKKRRKKYSNEELLELIKQKEISRKELHDVYRKQYKELQKSNPEIEDYLKWVAPIGHPELFESAEVFQKFIDDNCFENEAQLQKKHPGIYKQYRLNRGGFKDKIVWKKPKFEWKQMTVDELQKFVDDNEVLNKYDLSKRFPKLAEHSRAGGWGILDSIKFPVETTYGRWDDYNSVDDFQKFIDENNITSKKNFNTRFRGLWQRARNRDFLKDLKFCGDPIYDSVWEKNIVELLRKELPKETEIQTHTILTSCVDKGPLKLDIMICLNNTKIAIEIQGPYHFNTTFNKLDKYVANRKHDIQKHRYFVESNIPILYFSYSEELIEEFGYPYYISLKEDELLKDIKSLLGIL